MSSDRESEAEEAKRKVCLGVCHTNYEPVIEFLCGMMQCWITMANIGLCERDFRVDRGDTRVRSACDEGLKFCS